MTSDEWKKLPPGTPVRMKSKKGDSYLNTKTKRHAYSLSSGTVVVRLEGVADAVPVRDLEVIPDPGQAGTGSYVNVTSMGVGGP